MILFKRIIALTLFCFTTTIILGQKVSLFDSIMQNIRMVEMISEPNISRLETDVNHNISSIENNGSWSDINYASKTQTSWNPGLHLKRLHSMAIAFANKDCKYYKNETLLNKIIQGLQYWYDSNPISTNWYNQQIFSPKQIGVILVLIHSDEEDYPNVLAQKLLTRMQDIGGIPNGRYSAGSSNRINIAAHWIYRACLTQNSQDLDFAVAQALLTFKFNERGGGLQPDFSFQEHGKQLYIGNYGYEFIENLSNIALYIQNTRYNISTLQQYLLSTFCRETYLNVIRGKYYSYSIPGRQVANLNALDRSKNIGILHKMLRLDTIHKSDYEAAINRWIGKDSTSQYVTPIHRHFYFSDYSFYNTPQYFFDIRSVSNRTVRTENINNENKKGYFLSDGAYNILINGSEYFNIFPTWDWSHIPGTTAPHIDSLPDMKVDVGGDPGATTFVGGLSDSTIGISTYTMDYNRFQTKANKSWFIFDDQIVCLGSNIASASDYEINTTINQSNWVDKVQQFALNSNNYILHNDIAYQIPTKEKYEISTKMQYGNWKTISDSQKDSIVSQKVFSLWINHHIKPQNASYQYIIIPNIHSKQELIKYLNTHTTEVLFNDEKMQSVASNNLLQAAIYKENQHLKYKNVDLTIKKPSLLMIKKLKENQYKISISDPRQHLTTLEIEGVIDNKKINWSINLPQNKLAGATTSFVFNTK